MMARDEIRVLEGQISSLGHAWNGIITPHTSSLNTAKVFSRCARVTRFRSPNRSEVEQKLWLVKVFDALVVGSVW